MSDISGLIAYGSFFLVLALINGIACLGLNIQWGQTGLFNVGIAGFIAIGAYVSAILTTPFSDGHLGGFGLPMALGWIGGMVAAGAVSAVIGWMTLRLRSDYLAITTFGVAVTVHLLVLNAQSITGGSFGIGFIPRPFESLAERPALFGLLNLLLVGGLVVLLYLVLERLIRSPWGRVLKAVREDERAASSLGKNASHYRLQAFALGGALMGLSGAIHAHFIGFIAPDNYLSAVTFQIWAMLIVGGSGNNLGALVGAFIIWGLWSLTGLAIGSFFAAEDQARAAALRIVAIGVMLSATILYRPRGLFGERATVSRHIQNG
jgi:branched-chain amino acid transport system permease protein